MVTATEFEVFLKVDYEAKYGEEPLYSVINSSFTIEKASCTHPAIPMMQKFMFNKYEENNDF